MVVESKKGDASGESKSCGVELNVSVLLNDGECAMRHKSRWVEVFEGAEST
jgi:hypothetical protein